MLKRKPSSDSIGYDNCHASVVIYDRCALPLNAALKETLIGFFRTYYSCFGVPQAVIRHYYRNQPDCST
jgi:hypothetical protein